MKTVTVRNLQKKVKQCVDNAQEDRVIIRARRKQPAISLDQLKARLRRDK